MPDYTPNSHKYKAEQQEREKQQKVIEGKAKRKKKSELGKLRSAIVSEDSKNVSNHLLFDVLVPALKNAVSDMVTDGINMVLFGDSKRSSGTSRRAGYYSYDTRYNETRDNYARRSTRSSGYEFDDIIITTRGEAEAVLNQMRGILEQFGVVRVADFYELVGEEADYTDNKYGWSGLRTADVAHVRDGYILRLPKATLID